MSIAILKSSNKRKLIKSVDHVLYTLAPEEMCSFLNNNHAILKILKVK